MNTDFIKGVIVPIVTPIDENEIIDEKRMRGLDVGIPYKPCLPTPPGPKYDKMYKAMQEAGLVE